MNLAALLAPKVASNLGAKGLLPHRRYFLIRTKAIEIVEARDTRGWSNTRAAKRLGLRSGAEFAQAYDCLKENGKRIVDFGDWSGVEAVIYAHFRDYEEDPEFLNILLRLGDPRVMQGGRLLSS
jgi:hypothetical protein